MTGLTWTLRKPSPPPRRLHFILPRKGGCFETSLFETNHVIWPCSFPTAGHKRHRTDEDEKKARQRPGENEEPVNADVCAYFHMDDRPTSRGSTAAGHAPGGPGRFHTPCTSDTEVALSAGNSVDSGLDAAQETAICHCRELVCPVPSDGVRSGVGIWCWEPGMASCVHARVATE